VRHKKRWVLIVAAVIVIAAVTTLIPLLLLGGGQAALGPLPERGSSDPGSPQARALAEPLSAFGFDMLLRQAERSDGNVVISPVSLHAALSMLRNGAKAETRRELTGALRLNGLESSEVDQGWADLITSAQSGEKTAVTICNSLWLSARAKFQEPFLESNRQYFAADCLALKDNPNDSVEEINQWVVQRTSGKITRIFDKLDPLTLCVLVNTVNLKVGWELFDEADTRPEAFTLQNGRPVDVTMMHGHLEADAGLQDDYTAVRLSTNGPIYVWVVVPRGESRPEDVVRELASGDGVRELNRAVHWSNVTLALPRFAFAYAAKDLIADLKAMGMRRIFDPARAQLGGITTVPAFHVTDVQHRARIQVDEKGVEAQAATGVASGCSGAPLDVEVRADRPFLVILTGAQARAPLFLAIVRDPR